MPSTKHPTPGMIKYSKELAERRKVDPEFDKMATGFEELMALLKTDKETRMNKYNPNESITCPKCGKLSVAEVMNVSHVPEHDDTAPYMRLTCSCGSFWHRRPLDYRES